jgi:hypothetical protein
LANELKEVVEIAKGVKSVWVRWISLEN